MKKRDNLYNESSKNNNADTKQQLYLKYKQNRNLIITLMQRSKINYYTDYFTEHQSNVKKLGKVYGT